MPAQKQTHEVKELAKALSEFNKTKLNLLRTLAISNITNKHLLNLCEEKIKIFAHTKGNKKEKLMKTYQIFKKFVYNNNIKGLDTVNKRIIFPLCAFGFTISELKRIAEENLPQDSLNAIISPIMNAKNEIYNQVINYGFKILKNRGNNLNNNPDYISAVYLAIAESIERYDYYMAHNIESKEKQASLFLKFLSNWIHKYVIEEQRQNNIVTTPKGGKFLKALKVIQDKLDQNILKIEDLTHPSIIKQLSKFANLPKEVVQTAIDYIFIKMSLKQSQKYSYFEENDKENPDYIVVSTEMPEKEISNKELMQKIQKVIEQVIPDKKQATGFLLYLLGEISTSEIENFGLKKNNLKNVKKNVAKKLQQAGITPSMAF